jgi:hypothetical protein
MTQRGDKLTFTIEVELVSDKKGGSMTMAYADNIATVGENGHELGNVGGRIGASYEIHDNATGETWRMLPRTFWYAFQEARKATEEPTSNPDYAPTPDHSF